MVAFSTIRAVAALLATVAIATHRALVLTTFSNVSRLALAHSSGRVATFGVLGVAVALVHAVGAPGERGAGQVAGGAEPPRPTLADAENPVTETASALL